MADNKAQGVPSIPPKWFGYRHFAAEPLYLIEGHLYYTPASESEYCLFRVSEEESDRVENIAPVNTIFRFSQLYIPTHSHL